MFIVGAQGRVSLPTEEEHIFKCRARLSSGEVTFFPSGKKKKKFKKHTYIDRTQYRNIKFLLCNCCQVRHLIKNYNRVSMTAHLNAEKGPSNSALFKSQH